MYWFLVNLEDGGKERAHVYEMIKWLVVYPFLYSMSELWDLHEKLDPLSELIGFP